MLLLDLLAPPGCLACGRPPPPGERLCRPCRRALRFLGDARCPRCALPVPCGRRCPAAGHAYAAAWSPVAYAGAAQALVHALKERGALGAAGVMAAQVVAGVPEALLAGDPVVVAVPPDPRRRRRRGVDHAGRLAAEVARRAGLPRRALLTRTPGPRHAGAPRAARLGAGASAAPPPAARLGEPAGRWDVRVRGAPPPPLVLLVDDVHTTGGTLDACARALRAAGCAEVRAVAYARTLPGALRTCVA